MSEDISAERRELIASFLWAHFFEDVVPVSAEELLSEFSASSGLGLALDLLRAGRRLKDADLVEYGIAVGGRFDEEVSAEYLALCRVLLRDWWHRSHEDLIELLGEEKDPEAVEVLYWVAGRTFMQSYWRPQAQRVVHALKSIGTPEAKERIRQLALSDDPYIRRGINNIHADEPRVRVSFDAESVIVYAVGDRAFTAGLEAGTLPEEFLYLRLWTTFVDAAGVSWWGNKEDFESIAALRVKRDVFDAVCVEAYRPPDLGSVIGPEVGSECEWVPERDRCDVPQPRTTLRLRLVPADAHRLLAGLKEVRIYSNPELYQMQADQDPLPVEEPYPPARYFLQKAWGQ